MKAALILSMAIAAVLLVGAAGATPGYATVDLGTLGGTGSYASAINDRGQIVGSSSTASGVFRPFLWQDGVMIDLGTFGGDWSFAAGINERGQVVGTSQTSSGEYHAFLWEKGELTDLGTLGGGFSSATEINERGQVVGCSTGPWGQYNHAFLWESGVMTDLGTPATDYSCAAGINDRGQVAGTSISNTFSAVVWHDGVSADLGSLGTGTGETWANAINNRGQVVGYSAIETGEFHWFLWEDGEMTDLTPDSTSFSPSGPAAYDINERGQVVGTLNGPTPNDTYAALWDHGSLIELAPFSAGQSSANAINNRGQVVGSAQVAGNSHAMLWQPAK